jgi:hypothetical protein
VSTSSVVPRPEPVRALGYDAGRRRLVGVTADDRAAWGRAFPTVHIAAELRRAEIYLGSTRRRPRSLRRFLVRWFAESKFPWSPATRGLATVLDLCRRRGAARTNAADHTPMGQGREA